MPYEHTKEEARKLCIEALRSGKYQQGKRALCQQTPEGRLYCCLGVFCEVYSQHEVPLETDTRPALDKGDLGPLVEFEGYAEGAPRTVCRWLGLRDDLGTIGSEWTDGDSLARRNDLGQTFDQIADFMEQHPDQVFGDLAKATPTFVELPKSSEAP